MNKKEFNKRIEIKVGKIFLKDIKRLKKGQMLIYVINGKSRGLVKNDKYIHQIKPCKMFGKEITTFLFNESIEIIPK